jgi:hypothetical protein
LKAGIERPTPPPLPIRKNAAGINCASRPAKATLKAALETGQAEAAELSEAQERLRCAVSGALAWQLSQQFPERSWAATKALRAADARRWQRAREGRRPAAGPAAGARALCRDGRRIWRAGPAPASPGARAVALDREAQAHLQDIAVAELNASNNGWTTTPHRPAWPSRRSTTAPKWRSAATPRHRTGRAQP